MGLNQSSAVDRCVQLISVVLDCRRKSSRVSADEARAAYNEAVDLFDRLSPETLTEALHALYRKAERDSRKRAEALERLRRRTKSA